jgi:hypothetical protein
LPSNQSAPFSCPPWPVTATPSDAAVDFSAELVPVKRHAAKPVRNPGRDDIERGLIPLAGLDECGQEQLAKQEVNRCFHRKNLMMMVLSSRVATESLPRQRKLQPDKSDVIGL